MTDGLFDQAQGATDAAKRQALAALAQGGTAGLNDYKDAQRQLVARKAATARLALERAAAINAPEAGAELAAHGSLTGRPEAAYVPPAGAIYDRYATDSQRAATARQQAMADIAAANSNYFAQVNAARPIAESAAAQALAARRAKDAEADSITGILSQLGGIGVARDLAATYPGSPRFVPQTEVMGADAKFRPVPAKPGTFNFNGTLHPRLPTPEEAADEFANNVGLPDGYGRALLGPTSTAQPTQAVHRADVLTRAQQHASPGTVDALQRTLAHAGSLAAALTLIADTPDDDYKDEDGKIVRGLKSNGVSREKLIAWVHDYFAV